MSGLREVLREMTAAIFPWAPRHERRAAIAAAAAQREDARAGREHAQAVAEQIRRLARANHYAEILADDIIQGRRGKR